MFLWTQVILGSAHRINATHNGTDTIWSLWHEPMETQSAKQTGQSWPTPGSATTLRNSVRDKWDISPSSSVNGLGESCCVEVLAQHHLRSKVGKKTRLLQISQKKRLRRESYGCDQKPAEVSLLLP